jgi:hypothetical protein
MTSQINPADIDGNYPIAGVSNNTQGMRDNFTNTRTNFQYAADEITDLQSKAVLKAALTGTTLDNNLGNNVVYNALVKGISGTVVAIANTSGTITIDCSAGHYQSINMAGNIGLSFTSNTWPTAGTLGMIRTQITVDQAGRTLTLPNTVSNGIVGLQGYASNVITFANTGTYEFGFSTTNAGNAITIFDLNRPLSYYTNNVTIAANTVSTSPSTGALTVAGGVGVQGNLYVNGDIFGNVTLTDISVNTVTAVGNVVGGNLLASGNITGGNLLTSGIVSTSSNITGGNITAVNVVTTPTIVTNNIRSDDSSFVTIADGLNIEQGLMVTGDVVSGNLNAVGLISATGNITGGNVLGGANVNAITHTGTTVSVSANITGGNILSGAVLSAVGNATILSGTAVPAGGTTGAGYKMSSTTNLGIFFGSGAPTLSAAQGSLYLRTDGTTTNDRMYINTNSSTTWTAVITAA